MSEQLLFRRSAPYKPYTGSHLCSTKKLQNTKSTRFSRSCAFLLSYLVVRAIRGIFEFRSCILTCFLKNRTRTDDFVLIPARHLQFNTKLLLFGKRTRRDCGRRKPFLVFGQQAYFVLSDKPCGDSDRVW